MQAHRVPSLGRRIVVSLTSALLRITGAPAPARLAVEPSRTDRQRDGDEGESIARRHLEGAGLVFVAGNVRYRDGELDLVMREPALGRFAQPTLVFVEVRRRCGATHGGAIGSITFAKRRRLVAAAAHYLTGQRLWPLPPCRFDVVAIDARRHEWQVEWIRDAFRGEL